ncbi:TPA: hypothetical protein OQU49_004462, partial [Shigella flexneri]|nr:hypothetical protein [Shigella flexneri]
MSTVRAWVLNAASGVRVGEVRLAGSSSWAQRFGGGPLRAGVSVKHLTTRDGSSLDWAAIRQVRDWCEGGKHSLALTDGDRLLGEWLVVRRETGTSEDGVIPVTGFELDGYPAFRMLRKDYIYGAIDIAHLARNLLLDAFTWDTPAISITVPTVTAGVDIACR